MFLRFSIKKGAKSKFSALHDLLFWRDFESGVFAIFHHKNRELVIQFFKISKIFYKIFEISKNWITSSRFLCRKVFLRFSTFRAPNFCLCKAGKFPETRKSRFSGFCLCFWTKMEFRGFARTPERWPRENRHLVQGSPISTLDFCARA